MEIFGNVFRYAVRGFFFIRGIRLGEDVGRSDVGAGGVLRVFRLSGLIIFVL